MSFFNSFSFVTILCMCALQNAWQAKHIGQNHQMETMATWENNFPNQKLETSWPQWSWGKKQRNWRFFRWNERSKCNFLKVIEIWWYLLYSLRYHCLLNAYFQWHWQESHGNKQLPCGLLVLFSSCGTLSAWSRMDDQPLPRQTFPSPHDYTMTSFTKLNHLPH